MGIMLNKLKTIKAPTKVSVVHVSCLKIPFSCDLFHRAIEKETSFKIALPYTEHARKMFLQALFKGIDP